MNSMNPIAEFEACLIDGVPSIGRFLTRSSLKLDNLRINTKQYWLSKEQGEDQEVLNEEYEAIKSEYYEAIDFMNEIKKYPEVFEHYKNKINSIGNYMDRNFQLLEIYRNE